MSSNWKRRALLALVSASALVVAACGGGSIESQLQPSRIVAFGDSMSDLGQVGSRRYTVNDGSVNIWTQDVASRFGVSLSTAAAGGTSYATGNARISARPDAAGNAATPTVTQQIDAFLAGGAIGANDLVMVGGGIADIVAEMAKVTAATQTSAQMLANVGQAGRDLGAQVRRLVQAGATHVVAMGPYNLGGSAWAITTGQQSVLAQASTKFNEEFLVSVVDLGANVLYIDAALFSNQVFNNPAAYTVTNLVDPVCTSVDAGPGIGIGNGQVNSSLCDTSTLRAGANYGQYMYADLVYFTPSLHRRLGEYAHGKIRSRW